MFIAQGLECQYESTNLVLFGNIYIYIFFLLAAWGLRAHGIFSCGMQDALSVAALSETLIFIVTRELLIAAWGPLILVRLET